ncbi:hypothetical protein MTR67_047992 [Solanum verrucosum]|uniref:Uncharacterized protein n=1 Tax=Solanum verrucosum TaxID=315347 RepID=A0AAF0UXM8_SOLVR|nr:hypothetical protein MTR67_047992 [Solanum verrucosum]
MDLRSVLEPLQYHSTDQQYGP